MATGGRRRPAWGAVRVAYTLEQCWHRVPGGTAVAALAVARALVARPRRRRSSASPRRHRRPPPAPWRRRSRCARCRCPRRAALRGLAAAAAGRRSSGRPARSTSSTPPRSSSRPDTRAAGRHRARPGLPATTRSLHPPRRRASSAAASASSAGTPTWCCARRWRRWPTPTPPASTPTGSASCRSASTRSSDRRPSRRRRAPPARPAERPYLLFVGTLEPRKNLARLLDGADRSLDRPARWSSPGRDGWGDAAPRRAASVRLLGLRRPRRRRPRSTPAPTCSATRACARASACPCSRPWPRARRS